jgi:anti-sigma factor RsiW
MLDCTHAKDEFSALLDGELTQDERASVEAHLSQCAECLRELDKIKSVDTLYRELPHPTTPYGFVEQVQRRLRP